VTKRRKEGEGKKTKIGCLVPVRKKETATKMANPNPFSRQGKGTGTRFPRKGTINLNPVRGKQKTRKEKIINITILCSEGGGGKVFKLLSANHSPLKPI